MKLLKALWPRNCNNMWPTAGRWAMPKKASNRRCWLLIATLYDENAAAISFSRLFSAAKGQDQPPPQYGQQDSVGDPQLLSISSATRHL